MVEQQNEMKPCETELSNKPMDGVHDQARTYGHGT